MIDYLNSLPLAGLLLAISIGYLVGNLTFRDIALGPAGATLFVSLLLGSLGIHHLEFDVEGSASFSIGTFGFILYLYSIGFEAGPRFFASFRDRSGWKYALVATVVNVAAVAGAFCAARIVGLGATRAAGAMAGALTSCCNLCCLARTRAAKVRNLRGLCAGLSDRLDGRGPDHPTRSPSHFD